MTLDEYVRTRAQYIADHIDVAVFLELTNPGMTPDQVFDAVGPYLRDNGWQGRKYPLDYFTVESIPDLS